MVETVEGPRGQWRDAFYLLIIKICKIAVICDFADKFFGETRNGGDNLSIILGSGEIFVADYWNHRSFAAQMPCLVVGLDTNLKES
jgi:hypothetical protein